MKPKINFLNYSILILIGINLTACKKLVETPEPTNTITATETFSNTSTATSALVAIYGDMTNQAPGYADGATTFYCGASADELLLYQAAGEDAQIQDNKLLSSTNIFTGAFWNEMYFDIYMANGIINGLQASNTVSASAKQPLIAEAKFLRAFDYFYLVNLYGGVPLVTTTDYNQTALLPRATTTQIYQLITADLEAAIAGLPIDYSASNGQRVRANKWAATALLARVDLYLGNWADAAKEASAVISNTGTYSLVSNLNNVFLANSTEAILQLIPTGTTSYAVPEAYINVPYPPNTGNPNYYLTDQLLKAFEPGDQRRAAWVDSTNYSGVYYYPYKYKVQIASQNSIPEYYMVLRLAEQYLIRAEAEANNNDSNDAIADLNAIRHRAGLPNYPGSSDKNAVLNAIYHERQIELFAEWGHRWFDLKRTGQANSVLSAISYKQPWHSTQLLYPIPYPETITDPNLTQNPGY
ncbi:MAG: RagB/SusD family nutrient uptake outer membrane protein [Mucilaginibacter sp.]